MHTTQLSKVRENRLRREAVRQGLALEKSRRRDPRAADHGTYSLTGGSLAARRDGMSLDEVEAELSRGRAWDELPDEVWQRTAARQDQIMALAQRALELAAVSESARAELREVTRKMEVLLAEQQAELAEPQPT